MVDLQFNGGKRINLSFNLILTKSQINNKNYSEILNQIINTKDFTYKEEYFLINKAVFSSAS